MSAPPPPGRRQARWREPLIWELGHDGETGVVVAESDPAIADRVGDVVAALPDALRRRRPPDLPQLSQPRLVKHFLRLSQETLGNDLGDDVGLGTSTLKYNPKVNDHLLRSEQIAELHPLQDVDTVQGVLAILWGLEQMLRALSGMARFSFQPGGGAQAIYTNARIMRAYHEERGEAATRDEVITTVFSHPANAAAPATAGYRIVTLYPEETGLPSLEALAAATSERTAGLMITNPEDTGIFNPEIDRYVDVVHEAGGLCAYDQANANGLLGITRAREAGFDMCHFNLHKSFASPHGSGGPATGAVGVTEALERFLPVPVVTFDGSRYDLEHDRPSSIGRVRSWYGVVPAVVRAYAWLLSLGPDGVRAAAATAVLNNNYLAARLESVPGLSVPYRGTGPRIEQVRYSWQRLKEETGVGTLDVGRRIVDYGASSYFTSHHPWLVPEPMILEPTESVSRDELDLYAANLARIAAEAYERPEHVRAAPHDAPVHQLDERGLSAPDRWAMTWRAHRRKLGG